MVLVIAVVIQVRPVGSSILGHLEVKDVAPVVIYLGDLPPVVLLDRMGFVVLFVMKPDTWQDPVL